MHFSTVTALRCEYGRSVAEADRNPKPEDVERWNLCDELKEANTEHHDDHSEKRDEKRVRLNTALHLIDLPEKQVAFSES